MSVYGCEGGGVLVCVRVCVCVFVTSKACSTRLFVTGRVCVGVRVGCVSLAQTRVLFGGFFRLGARVCACMGACGCGCGYDIVSA